MLRPKRFLDDDSLNKKLKGRLTRRELLLVPGAPNALTARIIEDIGFDAIYVTGAGVTNMYLGVPDLGFITLTELADHVASIRDVTTLPLVVDTDTGFGNALNVRRTVKILERRGANAIQIEDQIFPKRCGHFHNKRIISNDEMVQKIHAATDARQNDDFIARTDARAVLGFSEAIERALQYFEAGADVTFVEAPQTMEEIAAIPQRIPCPQVINMVVRGRTPLMSLNDLKQLNYSIAIYANAALQGAIRGMQIVLKHLYENGSITEVLDCLTPFDERQRLVGKHVFDELEKKYETK
jgi:2-methylisocitrate lyase-like PEP mutase family enzyme